MILVTTSDIGAICRRWQIKELSLFGSANRDDFGPDSDIDLLVTFEPDAAWSTFDFVDLRAELIAAFGRPVDLVERATLRNPFRRKRILASRKVLYAA